MKCIAILDIAVIMERECLVAHDGTFLRSFCPLMYGCEVIVCLEFGRGCDGSECGSMNRPGRVFSSNRNAPVGKLLWVAIMSCVSGPFLWYVRFRAVIFQV